MIETKKMIKIDGFRCDRCGHEWVARDDKEPITCPKCKSPYWNTPKINGNTNEENAMAVTLEQINSKLDELIRINLMHALRSRPRGKRNVTENVTNRPENVTENVTRNHEMGRPTKILEYIGFTIKLHNDGFSAENIARKIKEMYGVDYDRNTIAKWIQDYEEEMKDGDDDDGYDGYNYDYNKDGTKNGKPASSIKKTRRHNRNRYCERCGKYFQNMKLHNMYYHDTPKNERVKKMDKVLSFKWHPTEIVEKIDNNNDDTEEGDEYN